MLNYLKLVYIYNFTILIKPMENLETAKVPKDKFILLIDNRQDQRLIKINDNKKFNWRKTPIPVQSIADYPFYTSLEVGNHKLEVIDWEFEEPNEEEENDDGEQVNNNRQIFQIQQAQKLQINDIQQMKKQLKPSQIISGLVSNNQQFNKRSQYSKIKYLKKKQRKYMFKFHAQPTNLESLHQYYFKQDPRSIGWIRWDVLALQLLYSSPFNRVLISEQTKGILLGSALSRGTKLVTVADRQKKSMRNYPIADQLNIPKNQQDKVIFASWAQLTSNKQQRFDNFIVLGNYNFSELIQQVEPLLKQGAIISLFCQSLHPLEETARLMKQKKYLNIKLQDSWCRQYQVLHNRTHPLMYMDSSSGYLLTGFKVT